MIDLPEMRRLAEGRLDERALPGEARKKMESIQRWLKGAKPTVNSYAKTFEKVASTGAVDKAVESSIVTVSNTLKEMVTLLDRLDAASRQALTGKG